MANQKLGNPGDIILSFVISKFSILAVGQNGKLGFRNLEKKFLRFPRFLSFQPSLYFEPIFAI